MKKLINLAIIIAFLVGVCIWEEISINKYLSEMEGQVVFLETKMIEEENIDTEEFVVLVKDLEEFWLKKESTFCVILNHKEVELIGEEIARAMAAVINNSKEDFVESVVVLKFYIKNLAHILGLSWQNLI